MTPRRKGPSKDTQHGMLPTTSPFGPRLSDAFSLTAGLSRAADKIKWPRSPELGDLEKMAELPTAAGLYQVANRMGASESERAQL